MPKRSAWDPDKAPEQKERRYDDRKPRGKDPVAAAVASIRYRVTDLGVKFALDAAAAGAEVVYASDWSAGVKNEEALRAAGVELHTGLRSRK